MCVQHGVVSVERFQSVLLMTHSYSPSIAKIHLVHGVKFAMADLCSPAAGVKQKANNESVPNHTRRPDPPPCKYLRKQRYCVLVGLEQLEPRATRALELERIRGLSLLNDSHCYFVTRTSLIPPTITRVFTFFLVSDINHGPGFLYLFPERPDRRLILLRELESRLNLGRIVDDFAVELATLFD